MTAKSYYLRHSASRLQKARQGIFVGLVLITKLMIISSMPLMQELECNEGSKGRGVIEIFTNDKIKTLPLFYNIQIAAL